jgi:hypothetical protein
MNNCEQALRRCRFLRRGNLDFNPPTARGSRRAERPLPWGRGAWRQSARGDTSAEEFHSWRSVDDHSDAQSRRHTIRWPAGTLPAVYSTEVTVRVATLDPLRHRVDKRWLVRRLKGLASDGMAVHAAVIVTDRFSERMESDLDSDHCDWCNGQDPLGGRYGPCGPDWGNEIGSSRMLRGGLPKERGLEAPSAGSLNEDSTLKRC